jgi:hypothetical protein
MKIEFSGEIFEKKSSHINLHKNAFDGSRILPSGRTDGRRDAQTGMTVLTVLFFAILRTRRKITEV